MLKPNALQRLFLLGLCLAFSALLGCADDSKHCTGSDCGVIESGCEPACQSGESCVSGQCMVRGASCSQAGESCLPGYEEASGFVCMDWRQPGGGGAVCSTNCAFTGECGSGSACYALHSNTDSYCQSAGDCPEGKACLQGVCRFAACQPSNCSGPVSGQAECDEKFAGHPDFPYGTRCVPAGNDAHFCAPAGTREVGEVCVDAAAAAQTQNYPATCAAGLSCVDDICLQSCANDNECDAPETCVLEAGEAVGFCANSCAPFEADSCPAGEMCKPLTGALGQCVPAGVKEAFARCEPGAEECAAGTLCVAYPGAGGEARCQPICDLSPSSTAEDGSIAPGAQAARDATCPQPETAPASLRLAHVADLLGAVDIYLDSAADPLVEGLAFDGAFPDDATWYALPSGRYRLRALPAGAPRSDLPLADFNIDLVAGQGTTALLAVAKPSAAEDAEFLSLGAAAADARSAQVDFRLVHLVADLGAIDVVLIAANADASNFGNHTVLAENLRRGEARPAGNTLFELPAQDVGMSLKLLVFPSGSDRGDPARMLFETDPFRLNEDATLILNGTMDEGDLTPSHLLSQLAMGDVAPASAAGARYSCVELAEQPFGVCQQICAGGAADYGQNTCEGEGLGCAPVFLSNRQQWQNLCAPVGAKGVDDACDPYVAQGQCAEGLYCQALGVSQAGMSLPAGRCTPLCDVDAPHAGAPLGCEAAQACQALEPGSNFEIGRCGWTCEPGTGYQDTSCPEGLDRCEPNATLRDDLSGQAAPQIHYEQPFCAAAGPRQPGENCQGNDCAAGSECLFPRSVQTDFTSTLASPYFGGPGLVPVCMPSCDPFDADSSANRCATGETCLFNAWNAEVGHCAPIAENLAPLERCAQPGLACGEDSICALSQNTPICLRFCDYLGTDSQGAYLQSTCPGDLRCEPLINDIGICQTP